MSQELPQPSITKILLDNFLSKTYPNVLQISLDPINLWIKETPQRHPIIEVETIQWITLIRSLSVDTIEVRDEKYN